MPQAEFKISGEIKDFTRVDNIYRTLKREGEKILENWTIDFNVSYIEKKGEIEIPE